MTTLNKVGEWEKAWEGFVTAEQRYRSLDGRKMSRAHYIKALRKVWSLNSDFATQIKLPLPW